MNSQAMVESSVPLTDEEKHDLKAQVDRLIGRPVSYEFLVRPEVLGGLRITVGDWVLDTTLARQLEDLKATLL